MKLASMLRRLRNTRAGMRSTAGSGSTPYTPYTNGPFGPVAHAGSDQTVSVKTKVYFDGSDSTDPDGGNLYYSWAFGAGAKPATGRGVKPSCTYTTTGDKTVRLTVRDTDNNVASDTVTITVHSAPVADAGSDQDVSVNKTVSFDGSGSSDPDGGNLIYSWNFGTDATPSTGSGVMPSCTYSTTGAKTVTLTVTDDEGVSRSDTVTITVHSLPVANAGDDQGAVVGGTVSFDGSGSTGSNLSYSWAFGTDATPATGSGVMPSCTYSTPGAKIVELTVTDAAGATASDTATIYVFSWPPPPPVAEAGEPQTVLVGETVRFDGSRSTGSNLIYSWDFGTDATPATGRGIESSCSYSTTGEKTVTLTVTDITTSERPTARDTVTITVHNPPIADAGSDQRVAVGSEVSFDGSGSRDPDGGELSYLWDFGADATLATSSTEMPSCSYSTIGTKTVTLTVTDDEGATASDTVTITVHEAPIADAGNPQTVILGSEVTFDGRGSSDPDGGNLSYSWDFGDGADPPTAQGVMPFCIYDGAGDKTVTLTVTDDEGATASDTVVITVVLPLKVTLTADPGVVAVSTRVEFTRTVLNAPEGVYLRYSWDFGIDAVSKMSHESGLSCVFVRPGEKEVSLTVSYTTTDGKTFEATGTCVIKVFNIDAGRPQVAAVGERVEFTGAVEDVPEGATLIYSWHFGGVVSGVRGADGLTPSCVYPSAGEKTVTLTVTATIDGETGGGKRTVKITVLESRLRVQGVRALSDLELAAFRLVFGTSLTPPRIEIFEHLDNTGDTGGATGQYDADRDVLEIARDKHRYAEDLDGDTTVDDIDLTRPGNIKYLATLIHEAGHHWQSIHNEHPVRIPNYKFDNEVLETLDFECKEQHAAVGQVYFILKWQLHHGHDPINLTDGEQESNNVGPASRYASIALIPPSGGHRHIDPAAATLLVNNFGTYLADLHR